MLSQAWRLQKKVGTFSSVTVPVLIDRPTHFNCQDLTSHFNVNVNVNAASEPTDRLTIIGVKMDIFTRMTPMVTDRDDQIQANWKDNVKSTWCCSTLPLPAGLPQSHWAANFTAKAQNKKYVSPV